MKKFNKYEIILALILIFQNLSSASIQFRYATINTYFRYLTYGLILLLMLFFVAKLNKFEISYYLILPVVIGLIGVFCKNSRIMFTSLILFLTINLKPKKILNIYGMATVLLLIGICLFQLLNQISYINKNTWGYYILVSMLYLFFKIDNNNFKKRFLGGVCILILALFLENYLHDRTADYLIILFIISYVLKIYKTGNLILKQLIVMLPIILTVFSIYLSLNYGKYSWISDGFNNLLSYRISIWDNLWSNYNISIFPQDILQYAYGYSAILNQNITAADGFFAIGILIYGCVIYLIYIFSISAGLFKYFRLNLQDKMIFYFIFILIFYGFTETGLDNCYSCCLIPLSMSLLKENKYKVLEDE